MPRTRPEVVSTGSVQGPEALDDVVVNKAIEQKNAIKKNLPLSSSCPSMVNI
jgi:hypothetical protein